jgi:hypothetical protein
LTPGPLSNIDPSFTNPAIYELFTNNLQEITPLFHRPEPGWAESTTQGERTFPRSVTQSRKLESRRRPGTGLVSVPRELS